MLEPKLKGRQHYDEKYVKVKKEFCYDLNCIDNKTKFITAHLFVDKRSLENCVKFLSQIKKTCYNQILAKYYFKKFIGIDERIIFVCDGFENYRNAFNKLFYRVAELKFGVPIKCKKYGLKYNNNAIERYNGTLKNRLKIMRGEFRNFLNAEAFMNLQKIIHNFVNPYREVDEKTPAEKAEIKTNLEKNKLLNLIRYAAKCT